MVEIAIRKSDFSDQIVDACSAAATVTCTLTTVTDDATDGEDTYPPSDTESDTLPPSSIPPLRLAASEERGEDSAREPDVSLILLKMEELNKLNEADQRSVTSRRSAASDSSSSATTTSRSEICAPPVAVDAPLSAQSNGGGDNTTTTNSSSARSVGAEAPASAKTAAETGCGGQQPTNNNNNNNNNDDEEENIDLWTVWGNLIKSWEVEMKRRPNCVKELVRRGVPQHFRTIAWQLLANANARQVHDQYTEYLRQTSPYEKIILRDIPRTYPEREFFKDGGRGQQSLFNVIKSYSIHDREVGYCQGSAFIVGQLLLQMPEEEAFAVFVRLMEHYRLRELYKPMMTELGLCMFQLEYIVQEQMPDLYMHFNNMGFDTSMYASSWFLTLFTTTLPLELANRIMDLFLVDGMDAIFRVAIAILQQARIELLKVDMEGMLKYFQREVREMYENDHDLLFAVASRVILNAKRMKKLEKDYLAKRSKEQEEAIELRRLRTENRLLRQRIDYLEHESSALADRLIRGQVDLAQQADNCLSISHELNILRDVNSAAHRRLEDAYETIRELSCADVAALSGAPRRPTSRQMSETGVQVDDTAMIEHIHSLQQELIETHCKKSDLENNVRELKLRIHELESANKRLKESSPENGIATIQEELIRVKMREAESSLSLKEMRQRLAEIEQQWTKYMQTRYQFLHLPHSLHDTSDASVASDATTAAASSPLPTSDSPGPIASIGEPGPSSPPPPLNTSAAASQQPSGAISPGAASTCSSVASSAAPPPAVTTSASLRARERLAKFTASLIGAAGSISAYGGGGGSSEDGAATSSFDGMTLTELEDHFMGLKIREADTLAELKEMRQRVMELETQNHVCTNQLKRQDDELRRIREEKDAIAEAEKEASKLLKEEQRKLMESQSEMKEKNVMQRLKYTEALQTVADLRQHIAHIESKSAEKFAHAQLRGSSICDMDDDSLASGRSAGSLGGADDTNSLASEEMSAFLADVTTKPYSKEDVDDLEVLVGDLSNGHVEQQQAAHELVSKTTPKRMDEFSSSREHLANSGTENATKCNGGVTTTIGRTQEQAEKTKKSDSESGSTEKFVGNVREKLKIEVQE